MLYDPIISATLFAIKSKMETVCVMLAYYDNDSYCQNIFTQNARYIPHLNL